MTSPAGSPQPDSAPSRSLTRGWWQLGFTLLVGVAVVAALVATPARPVAPVIGAVAGALLTLRATGLGRRRTVIAVWHDALHPGGVERRLLGVAFEPDVVARLVREAKDLPGFGEHRAGISTQPEAVGVLDTAEAWRVWARLRRARLDNEIGATVWFVTDAEDATDLLPGDSALGFAATQESAKRLVAARRAESLHDPATVRGVEVPIGSILWPRGVTRPLGPARPLTHHDGDSPRETPPRAGDSPWWSGPAGQHP